MSGDTEHVVVRSECLTAEDRQTLSEVIECSPWLYTEFGVQCSCGNPVDTSDDSCQRQRDLHAAVESIVARRVAEVEHQRDRLKRGGAELGKSLHFWMELARKVTDSDDLIEDDGDGDWGGVAERLSEMGDEVKRLRTAVPTPEAHARQVARAERAEAALAEQREGIVQAIRTQMCGDDFNENAASAAGEGEWSWFRWEAARITNTYSGDQP